MKGLGYLKKINQKVFKKLTRENPTSIVNIMFRRRGASSRIPNREVQSLRTPQAQNIPEVPISRPVPIRRFSDETISTLVNDQVGGEDGSGEGDLVEDNSENRTGPDSTDLSTILTTDSDETICNTLQIFGIPFSYFSVRREFPIVSNYLLPGNMVFESASALLDYRNEMKKSTDTNQFRVQPMLHCSVPVLGLFKKTSPFVVIHKYNEIGEKIEFCTVYFKILDTNLTSYILIFNSKVCSIEPIILLNNDNSFKPSVDFVYKGTKTRILGISGATSTFGTSSTRTFIMDKKSVNLADNLNVEFAKPNQFKNLKIKASKENELANLLIGNKSNTAKFKNLMNSKSLLQSPFATYVDNGDKRIGSMLIRHGTICCFDEEGAISENTLVIACINLVLREQEYRKNKGNNKPMFITHANLVQNAPLALLNTEVRGF